MIPYSRPNSLIYIPYPRANCLEIIPFAAAHTYIAHIWQYPPPPTPLLNGGLTFLTLMFKRNYFPQSKVSTMC